MNNWTQNLPKLADKITHYPSTLTGNSMDSAYLMRRLYILTVQVPK